MVLLLRLLSRIVGILLLALLALVGLAAAVFCIQGDHGTLSIPALASYVHLSTLRDAVATELRRLQASGPVAWVSLGAGAGTILLGLLLLVGVLVPARERLVVLRREPDGTVAARRRALGQAVSALAEQPPVVLQAHTRVRPRRRRPGGRLRVRAEHAERYGGEQVATAVRGALGQLTDSLPLRVKVKARPPRRGRRVA